MELLKSRKRFLPVGWYPDTEKQILNIFTEWEKMNKPKEGRASCTAAVVPHAGWFFSGEIAFRTLSLLKKPIDTVVVVGGHLPGGAFPLCYTYQQLETPLGVVPVDTEFIAALIENRTYENENTPDNTVEIQLPMVKYLFPKSKVVALRVGADREAEEIGSEIYAVSKKLKRSTVVIGSTDLTHYGDTYHFTPHGYGQEALSWVKNNNDKSIIDAMTEMNSKEVILLGTKNKAACSSGAAVCALSFAKKSGSTQGRCAFYKTSYDVYPGESFVGYAGICF